MAEQGSEFRGFVYGLVGGAALGAALGLLFAPQAGAATRRQIRDRAQDAGKKVGDLIEEAGDLLDKAAALFPAIGRESTIRKRLEDLRAELQKLQTRTESV